MKSIFYYLFQCFTVLFYFSELIASPPDQTTGEIWPLPRYVSYGESFMIINISTFNFKVTKETCDIINEGLIRYKNVIKSTIPQYHTLNCLSDLQTLNVVEVQLENPCESLPHVNMDESYEVHINTAGYEQRGLIKSNSVWGILRGLETISQLISSVQESGCLMVNSTDVLDYPRYSHRGLLLDTSRHYLPINTIYNILSGMETNKMNVLHWHIVDDQSFPYQSSVFPSLSGKGAYSSRYIYTKENISSIIQYATIRGIRVVPEFDSPGHTQSWGKGTSRLLTPCFTNSTFNGKYGPIDPTRDENFKFMRTLLNEVKSTFPDDYVHVGGDEVNYTCWQSNPRIVKFMKDQNITKFEQLEAYYIRKVLDILNVINVKGIVWQEVFQHNATLRNDSIVQIWVGNRTDLLYQVTRHGTYALSSEGWYLDHIAKQWEDYYVVDPGDFGGTHAQQALVLGGEACMWGEMVDDSNIVSRIWPRASAVAERLWSSKDICHVDKARYRLNEHVCRMKQRGIAAQPANGPGFCA